MGQPASPYPKLKRPATLDFLSAKPKPWRIVDIHADLDAVRALEETEKALGDAELRKAPIDALKAEVEQAREKVDKTTRQVLVAGISRKQKEDLIQQHEAGDEDHKLAREQSGNENAKAQWNSDTYPPALIAASLVEPKLSADEVRQLTEDWTDGEYLTLWMAVLQVNADSSLVSPGKSSVLSNGKVATNGA